MSAHDDYVTRLDSRLVGTRRAKRDLLTEVRDHLDDATEAFTAGGLTEAEAVRRAQHDFGDPRELAPSYQATLSLGLTRRLSLALFFVMIVQPVAWSSQKDSDTPGSVLDLLNTLVQTVGTAAMVAAVLSVALCGLGVRWLGVRPGILRAVILAAMVTSVLILAIAAAMNTLSPHATAAHALFTLTVVGVPFGLLLRESIRCMRTLPAVEPLARPLARR